MNVDVTSAHLLVPVDIANLVHGETHGIEAFANAKLADRWTLSSGYTFLSMHLHRDSNLLRGLHQEYSNFGLTEIPSLVRRSAYVRLTWRF